AHVSRVAGQAAVSRARAPRRGGRLPVAPDEVGSRRAGGLADMSDAAGAAPSLLRRHARAIAASVALLVALAWVLRAGALPLIPRARAFAQVDPWGVVGMAVLLLASTLLRLARYHLLIAPVAPLPLRRVMTISCVALGLLTFLPFRLGEVARPAM